MYECASVFAAVVAVAGITWRALPHSPRSKKLVCAPYLGEFVPPETSLQRRDREQWAELNRALQRVS